MPPMTLDELLEKECYMLREVDREVYAVSSVANRIKGTPLPSALMILACLHCNREWRGEIPNGTKKPMRVILSLDLV